METNIPQEQFSSHITLDLPLPTIQRISTMPDSTLRKELRRVDSITLLHQLWLFRTIINGEDITRLWGLNQKTSENTPNISYQEFNNAQLKDNGMEFLDLPSISLEMELPFMD
jgi:hypothetical protein